MPSIRDTTLNTLRRARRRLNQLRGRDVPFRPQIRVPSLHLGTEYGGWTVQPELLSRDSVVYSVGVGQDISFDLATIERFGCDIHAFDPTPKCIAWLQTQSLPQGFKFQPVGLADYDGVARFTVPREGFVSFRMGESLQGQPISQGESVVECPVRRLLTIMREAGHDHIDLLKMDIEGAEYPVIDDLLKSSVRPTQLLIEFHHNAGDEATLAKTRQAVEALNAAGYRIFAISPVGLEYSFIHHEIRK